MDPHKASQSKSQGKPGAESMKMGQSETEVPKIPPLKRLLIADDEHLMATGVANHVRALGYEVIGPVSDGASAIITAEAELPDLCLLDIKMLDAYDGLVAANEIWTRLGIPAILISAYSHEEYVNRAAETGVFGYLLKPVNAESLRVSIGIAWSRANEREALEQRIKQLEQSIENRKLIERAKWILVEATGMDEGTAHASMQRYARSTRQSLTEVATSLIEQRLAPGTITPKPAQGNGHPPREPSR